MSDVKNVVLVHGAWADGSGWEGVYHLLKEKGLNVSVVQNPTVTLEEDVTFTRRVLDAQDGPTVLVGHSYGGAILSEAGTHEKVVGLAYITAFAPDQGETVMSLIEEFPKDGPQPPILPPKEGFLLLDPEKFAASFAADVDPGTSGFMADAQVPNGLEALTTPITDPAWRHKPVQYLVVTEDQMIPPVAQRKMAERTGGEITETPGSHAIYISRPDVVAEVVLKAVEAAA